MSTKYRTGQGSLAGSTHVHVALSIPTVDIVSIMPTVCPKLIAKQLFEYISVTQLDGEMKDYVYGSKQLYL